MGDWVYIKLQIFIQTLVARRSSRKLSYKFFGPYLIFQRVGPVAYKLHLPQSSQMHSVIHVSQLKKAIPPGTQVSADAELDCIQEVHSIGVSKRWETIWCPSVG